MALKGFYQAGLREAGCDEAGRGCLAGPVFAAAVILPPDWDHPWLNDSKKLSPPRRTQLREAILGAATDWAVAQCDHQEIDQLNILQASITAMHKAIQSLKSSPELLLIDGNRFRPLPDIPHVCIIRGDGLYRSIAAASILAKTARDDYMLGLHEAYPQYGWLENKGYPTAGHRAALRHYGPTPYHRLSFRLDGGEANAS